jgi:hypothetical protein
MRPSSRQACVVRHASTRRDSAPGRGWRVRVAAAPPPHHGDEPLQVAAAEFLVHRDADDRGPEPVRHRERRGRQRRVRNPQKSTASISRSPSSAISPGLSVVWVGKKYGAAPSGRTVSAPGPAWPARPAGFGSGVGAAQPGRAPAAGAGGTRSPGMVEHGSCRAPRSRPTTSTGAWTRPAGWPPSTTWRSARLGGGWPAGAGLWRSRRGGRGPRRSPVDC